MVSCGVFFEIEDGRAIRLYGDKDDPASHGYTCPRGRDIATHLYGPNRLLRPLRRNDSGDLEETSSKTAVAEIAHRLEAIVDEHGPAAVAMYTGTYALAPPGSMLASAFMNALGSARSKTSTGTNCPSTNLNSVLARAFLYVRPSELCYTRAPIHPSCDH